MKTKKILSIIEEMATSRGKIYHFVISGELHHDSVFLINHSDDSMVMASAKRLIDAEKLFGNNYEKINGYRLEIGSTSLIKKYEVMFGDETKITLTPENIQQIRDIENLVK